MKLKLWHWIVLALAAYFVFLSKYMPAAWFLNSGMIKLPPSIIVSGVSGTIWNGQTTRVIAQGVAVDQLQWDLSFWSLLVGQVKADVLGGQLREPDAVYIKGSVNTSLFNPKAFGLTNTTILVPAQSVMGQIELPVPISAQGRFKADIATLDFDQTCQTLNGSGGWNNGMVNGLQGPIEFGSFTALLDCSNGDIKVKIQPQNKLQLDAMITIKGTGGFAIDGKFMVPTDMPNEVQQAATFFGRPDAQGFRVIDL